MKKYVIEIHTIQSDHLFATPEYSKSYYVEGTEKQLTEWLSKQTDDWGSQFKPNPAFGGNSVSKKFSWISNYGGLIINEYQEPKFEQLK